jgi:hypothetical protein
MPTKPSIAKRPLRRSGRLPENANTSLAVSLSTGHTSTGGAPLLLLLGVLLAALLVLATEESSAAAATRTAMPRRTTTTCWLNAARVKRRGAETWRVNKRNA